MKQVDVQVRAEEWIWSAVWDEIGAGVTDSVARIQVDGGFHCLRPIGEEEQREVEGDLGKAVEITRRLGADNLPVQVTLKVRYGEDFVAAQGEIVHTGEGACDLGDFEVLSQGCVDIGGRGSEARAYVARSLAHPSIEPLLSGEAPLVVDSQGMVTVAGSSGVACTVGFVSAQTHRPVVHLEYVLGTDEILVSGIARFNGRRLKPGEELATGWLVVRADGDPLRALEAYGDLIARRNPPRRTPPTIGWCSWYAIRMPISHAFALANARVVTERFRGLGMDLMLLDHGWQAGDICGDWDVDVQDFPAGLEGLARDLEERGLKLGLWIAPTDIAHSTRLFREHPEWMLRDARGRPGTTWRWYWEPHPLQCQLDATQDGAYRYLVDTFRRLTEAGAGYYKIDFIAACAREDLYPAVPEHARGWEPLKSAMRAIREGAGEEAYVRYCQTPPLLSAGPADGVYATMDTLDAGTSTWPVLREVFGMSAAQYWIHGRLYNHEACDLSVRAHGSTEECRLRVTMLALSGSSIMFSDDLTKLPEERIRLMQQCMPGFTQAARPLNLFSAAEPDLWHLHAEKAGLRWELVALFNFEEEQREFQIEWEALGVDLGLSCLVREFWTGAFQGVHRGRVEAAVPGRAVRLYSLWPALDRPQYAGTDLHLSQGLAELESLCWDGEAHRLRGTLRRAAGVRGNVYIHLPAGHRVVDASHLVYSQNGGLQALEVGFDRDEVMWEIGVEKAR